MLALVFADYFDIQRKDLKDLFFYAIIQQSVKTGANKFCKLVLKKIDKQR